MTSKNLTRIKNYIDLIRKKPKKDVNFFILEDGHTFIVDGGRLKLLPFDLHRLYAKDEFYIQIDAKEQKAMFYAYDIPDYTTGTHTKEEQGLIPWNDIEDCVYSFFVTEIDQLTESITPHLEAIEPINDSRNYNSHLGHSGYPSHSYAPPSHTATYSGYGTASYKEREAFFDKIWDLLKYNKTTTAMDLISNHLHKMCTDKKFDDIDTIFKMISFDKLTIPTMLKMLDATLESDKSLKARKDFFDKVKTHLTKIKPTRVGNILRNLEPREKNVDIGANQAN